MKVPLHELAETVATIHRASPGEYEVTFRLTEDGRNADRLYMGSRKIEGDEIPWEVRALAAENALRQIATACLRARVNGNPAGALETIVAAHNEWVKLGGPL